MIGKTEAQQIAAAGIRLFVVYEDYGAAAKMVLTPDQGKADATAAMDQASIIAQPTGSAIYFAVEGLPDGYKAADLPKIKDYFGAIKETIAGKYQIGVYSDGAVCEALLDGSYCRYTWLTAASYSFEGTKDFFTSGRWSLAQVGPLDLQPPGQQWGGRKIDINCANGDFGAFTIPTGIA